jgi:hypothetical protein
MVTLALTVVVPETVEPDEGEVIVTIRLPSCARAGSGMNAKPKISKSASALAFRLAVCMNATSKQCEQ